MTAEPEISIISACYNHGKYINEMLDSVFSQTFDNFEVVIADDGSDRDTRKILESINRQKVKVLFLKHRGPSEARNSAISNSRGSLILNLDSDDKIAPTLLEKGKRVFENNQNAGIVYADMEFFGAQTGLFCLKPFSMVDMLRDNLIHSTIFFRKKDWERSGGYCSEFYSGLEDYDFLLSLLELGVDVFKIPEVLCYYRKYMNLDKCRSGKRKKSREKMISLWSLLFKRHQQLYLKFPDIYYEMLQATERWKSENPMVTEIKEVIHYVFFQLRFLLSRSRYLKQYINIRGESF
ncbi:MAG: glycosyltransferase family 2 protein [Candidatus Riflebacteria bacterium]|nr:glycosyltransferase family 2 protein [Candidatus Riflebacteria bacterium]